MPMIDVYAAAGTFRDTHALMKNLATELMTIEQVPDIPMFRKNTAAFVHELPPGGISNVDGDSTYVRVQVLTNAGALDREKQLAVVSRLTEAGAVLTAKLTTGELAFGDQWFGGRTNNPWNLQEGSSGSSAGSGAAVIQQAVGPAAAELRVTQVGHAAEDRGNSAAGPPDRILYRGKCARPVGPSGEVVEQLAHEIAAAVVKPLDLTGVLHGVLGGMLAIINEWHTTKSWLLGSASLSPARRGSPNRRCSAGSPS